MKEGNKVNACATDKRETVNVCWRVILVSSKRGCEALVSNCQSFISAK